MQKTTPRYYIKHKAIEIKPGYRALLNRILGHGKIR